MSGQSATPNLDIWKKALKFHVRYHVELIPFVPILFIPLWTDCYHAVLARQAMTNAGKIQPFNAIGETMRLMPSFVRTKFKLFFAAYLWGLVPIIGWYKDLRYRVKWAMASNVHVFNHHSKEPPAAVCDRLADLVAAKNKLDALIAIPTLLSAGVLVIVLVGTLTFRNSFCFWLGGIMSAWIIFPGSAMANTLVYLSVTENLTLEELLQ